MEDQLLKRRLSTPRAATVVVLAAVVAVSVTVVPSVAQSFLTSQKAAKVYVSNKKASTLYLKKKAASNLYVAKATAPKPPVVGIAAGTAQFGPVSATTAGYIPTAFTSFATKAEVSSAVITFSGTGDLHRGETGPRPGLPGADPGRRPGDRESELPAGDGEPRRRRCRSSTRSCRRAC